MSDDDLSLVSTRGLLDELLRRFDHVLFAGLRCRGESESVVVRRWRGNSHTVAGLGLDVGFAAIADSDESADAIDLDDEDAY